MSKKSFYVSSLIFFFLRVCSARSRDGCRRELFCSREHHFFLSTESQKRILNIISLFVPIQKIKIPFKANCVKSRLSCRHYDAWQLDSLLIPSPGETVCNTATLIRYGRYVKLWINTCYGSVQGRWRGSCSARARRVQGHHGAVIVML